MRGCNGAPSPRSLLQLACMQRPIARLVPTPQISPEVSELLSRSEALLSQLIRRDDLQAGAAPMPSR